METEATLDHGTTARSEATSPSVGDDVDRGAGYLNMPL